MLATALSALRSRRSGEAGRNWVVVRFDGLAPARESMRLIGPNQSFADISAPTRTARGGFVFRYLPTPRRGNHLVTIGHDGLTLTADCTLTVE